jgi:beta-ureidopropionase / N-carbamoyl-L-amino-acid hydrolase
MTAAVSVNRVRLCADLQALGEIGGTADGGVSRTSFSPADAQARAWYVARCAEAGLAVEVDGVGNIFVRSPRPAGCGQRGPRGVDRFAPGFSP